LEDAQRQLETSNKEQEALIDIFSEERGRRDLEEENLRGKLKDASSTIQDLLEQLNAARKGRKF
ncbi:Os04g0311100, partial [Oryza sativa Japonica Group]